MIRLVVTKSDATLVIHCGGSIEITSKVFEIEHPGLEAALTPAEPAANNYASLLLSYELPKAEGQ